MSGSGALSRREFIKLTGGGIFVFFTVGEPWDLLEAQQRGAGRELPTDFNAFIRIAEDGKVTGFCGKVELGQGPSTSLAQIAAEELDVPLDSVTMVLGDTAVCPWDMGTFGSRTTKYFGPPFRQAAAEARAALVQLASEKLAAPADRLATKDGTVFDTANPSSKATYAALAAGQRIELHIEPKPAVKPASGYTIVGRPAVRKDARAKATGRAEYAADIKVPGLRCARILRPPAHGAKLLSLDTSAAEAVPGARVVRDGDLVAVLHDSFDQADDALDKIKSEWEKSTSGPDDETIYDHLVELAPAGQVVVEKGSLEEGRKASASVFEGTYRTPYVAHAPIEPHSALVAIDGDHATVWASTQRPFGTQGDVAQALGLPPQNVRVIDAFCRRRIRRQEPEQPSRRGGASGQDRRAGPCRWNGAAPTSSSRTPSSRRRWSRSSPASTRRAGSSFWDYTVFYAGERSSEPFYDIPHYRVLPRAAAGRGRAAPGPSLCRRRLAGARQQHQHLRPRVADRHHGRQGGPRPVEFRSANLTRRPDEEGPPEQPLRASAGSRASRRAAGARACPSSTTSGPTWPRWPR